MLDRKWSLSIFQIDRSDPMRSISSEVTKSVSFADDRNKSLVEVRYTKKRKKLIFVEKCLIENGPYIFSQIDRSDPKRSVSADFAKRVSCR